MILSQTLSKNNVYLFSISRNPMMCCGLEYSETVGYIEIMLFYTLEYKELGEVGKA